MSDFFDDAADILFAEMDMFSGGSQCRFPVVLLQVLINLPVNFLRF